MLYPLMPQTQMAGAAEFPCKKMNAAIAVSTCMDWFVDHNALRRKDSPCFACQQGQENREDFARS